MKYKVFQCSFITAVMIFLLSGNPLLAQRGDDGVKKSTKTQVIDGKKYYLHTVEKGQTLYAIAKAYDLSINDIILENPGAMDGLKNGQVLKIPATKPATLTTPAQVRDTSTARTHKVESGQTLYAIAKMYQVKTEDLEKLNPEAKQGLKPGQILKLPAGVKPLTAGNTTVTAVTRDSVKTGRDSIPFTLKKKDRYNIALFLPFGLWRTDEVEPDKIINHQAQLPEKMRISLEFYEGMLLAFDSLKKKGYNLKLYVYESDENDSAEILNTLKKPEFETMDLIVGPLYTGPYQRVAKFASARGICTVSPMSQSNKVLFGNVASVKTTASLVTQMERLAEHVALAHSKQKVVVISSGNARDLVYVNAFKKSYDEYRHATGKDTVQVLNGISNLGSMLSQVDTTIVIAPTNSQAYVSDLVRMLSSLGEKNKLIVYGTASWSNFDNIDYEYLQMINYSFTTPYYFDYQDSLNQPLLHKYRSFYKGDASMNTIMGYDIGWYFGDALWRYGKDFYLKLPEIPADGYQQTFRFYKTDTSSGYENRGVHILRMSDYKLLKIR